MPLNEQFTNLATRGWARWPWDASIAAWAAHARTTGQAILADPAQHHWYRHGRTWFVGVDSLPNDAQGRISGGPPLQGTVVDALRDQLGFKDPWHRAQLSVCFPGYPRRDAGETLAQHTFRTTRDAAHVDGLLGEGQPKRRFMRELHHFILGLPLNECSADAAPFVLWEGSHHIMQAAFQNTFLPHHPSTWAGMDVTDLYQATRRKVFESCRRVVIHAKPGEAFLCHRFALHGVAPWASGATAPPDGRMIAYFRPPWSDLGKWLTAP